jgi:uncharacterized protein (DUF1697 family)
MNTFIILIRAVTPSGKNKVPMAQLREVLSTHGFKNVTTYIQTGNVLLETDKRAQEVQIEVHDAIKAEIGPDLAIIVRTPNQLSAMLQENPYGDNDDVSQLYFVLFEQPPLPDKIKILSQRDYGDEQLVITDKAACLCIPGVYGRGMLSSNFLEKKLGVAATMRNYNTMRKLVELSRQRKDV